MQANATLDPTGAFVPEGQEEHTDAPEAANWFTEQDEHEDNPSWEVIVPGSQGVQACCPPVEKVPAGHDLHTLLPLQRKEPAMHGEQLEAPEARSVPAGQGVHTPDPAALEVLTGQFVHGPVAPPETVFGAHVLHEVALLAVL